MTGDRADPPAGVGRATPTPADRASPVVTTTVRVLAPFVLTYGIYTTLHGTTSVGGGFQGGVVVAGVVVAFGFGFGVDRVRAALDRRLLVAGAVAGLALFGVVAAGSAALGGAFLEPGAYPGATAYAVELVEVAIALTVASVVAGLFLALAGGDDA